MVHQKVCFNLFPGMYYVVGTEMTSLHVNVFVVNSHRGHGK